ncbi:MAG: AtpZ/AtpI family protein [Eubacteriales bacterium]
MKQQNSLHEMMRSLGRIGGVAGFGLSVVTPLVLCILFAVWLRSRFGVGEWVIVAALLVGLISSGCGAYRSIRAFLQDERRSDAKKAVERPPLSPKRDPEESWHVGNAYNHDEKNHS